MKTILHFLWISSWAMATLAADLLPNGGFEQGNAGWRPLWTRELGTGKAALDNRIFHGGNTSCRIEHTGPADWSLNAEATLPTAAGDWFELEGWVKVQGNGNATLCVTTYDGNGQAVEWSYAARTLEGTHDWTHLFTRFVVPPAVAKIQPRLIGYGAATVWIDDVAMRRLPGSPAQRVADLATSLTISNALLTVTLHTGDGTLAVRDSRTAQTWAQKPFTTEVILTQAKRDRDSLAMRLFHVASGLEVDATLQLESGQPEFTLTLNAAGALPSALRFPHPFVSDAGTYLVVPMNEGISFPVEDASVEPMRLIAYGGHGICMAFWGVTDGALGHMAILETPDDASIRIGRVDKTLAIAPEWEAQKGQFGYARRLRYVFFDRGGHVAMCKRYRAYAQHSGPFKTLAQKRRENPNVDLLIGAVNVWYFSQDALPMIQEMQAAGIERILWSNRQSPAGLEAMNKLPGVLTGRYDIYQDTMNPENFKFLRGTHSDWTTEAWPNDLMLGPKGDWIRGWQVRGIDGQMYPCGVLCDRQAPAYAQKRIPAELARSPYRARFIDTTTASPWRECYAPAHPVTRSESRHWKMELLRYVCDEMKMVTGCETGHDAAVPYVHYFEGMLSLGPYRVPDSGRNMQQILETVPERVAKYQVGYAYRLPLWELVYHDCVVAQWYWGDYNNKLPSLWDRRDLFNALYGTPPMFMFSREFWRKNQDRFVRSYRVAGSVARATGYAEMTQHRFLTRDRRVQQTAFANGVTVTANFGEEPFSLPDGHPVAPHQSYVAGEKE
jgi:hypothetical protein